MINNGQHSIQGAWLGPKSATNCVGSIWPPSPPPIEIMAWLPREIGLTWTTSSEISLFNYLVQGINDFGT